MERKQPIFEEAVRNALIESKIRPSSHVLRKLRWRLWVSDFFGFNPGKVNIFYTGILMGGIASILLISNNSDVKEETLSSADINKEVIEEPMISQTELDVIEPSVEETHISEAAPLPAANFEVEAIRGCAPMEVNFTNKSMNASKYEWDFGTGDVSGKNNPVYIYNKAGKYTAVLTATNRDGRIAAYKKQIEVLDSPVADFEIDIENSDIAERKIVFKNTSLHATEYQWQFGDSQNSKSVEPAHTYAEYDAYTVRLIARDINGCSDTSILMNKFIEKNYSFSFPMSFRPNPFNRGYNGYYERAGNDASIFYPKNNGATEYKLKIKAPNGIEVFSTDDIKQGWNGYMGGRLAPKGVYTYLVSGIYPNGQSFALKGNFEVLVDDYY